MNSSDLNRYLIQYPVVLVCIRGDIFNKTKQKLLEEYFFTSATTFVTPEGLATVPTGSPLRNPPQPWLPLR